MEKTAHISILLVDDQKNYLASLADGLNACDGNVCILTAENGDRALKVLAANPVDMVVTDLRMPLMDGFELISQMKEKHPDIPTIVMSSFLDSWTEARLMALGVSRFIEKESLSFKSLWDLIVSVIRCRGVCRDPGDPLP
jgi:YesN/AraC family two-component response regulator